MNKNSKSEIKNKVIDAVGSISKEKIEISHLDVYKMLSNKGEIHISAIINGLYDIAVEKNYEIVEEKYEDGLFCGITIVVEDSSWMTSSFLDVFYDVIEESLNSWGNANSALILEKTKDKFEVDEGKIAGAMVCYATVNNLEYLAGPSSEKHKYTSCSMRNYRTKNK